MMDEFGVPLDINHLKVELLNPQKLWSQLVARDMRPEYEITCSATEEDVRSFLTNHLGYLDDQDVGLSVAGSQESVAWKAYSQFNLRRLLGTLIGDQTKEFTEFMIVGLGEQRYFAIQQEEYFTGIFAIAH